MPGVLIEKSRVSQFSFSHWKEVVLLISLQGLEFQQYYGFFVLKQNRDIFYLRQTK